MSPAVVNSRADEIADAVAAQVEARRVRPTAVCRMQFHAGFTFRDAAAVTPYLRDLGISHVYASPYFQARQGSRHGYDVCDYGRLNAELGGEAEYREFVDSLRKHGLGHIVDVVPNHMAAAPENPWWRDVLENGPNSPYSGFFDIDWHPVTTELTNRVLLPVLGAQFGEVLESGQLKIEHRDGGFELHYYDVVFPLGPKSVLPLLRHGIETLETALGATSESFSEYESILTALDHLPSQTATAPKAVSERQREKEVIKRRLRELEAKEPAIAEFLAKNIALFNGEVGRPESFDALDALLQAQAYRLCHWRAASDEINYRRFFDVNSLAAVCMEKPDVFHATHELVLRSAADGDVDGLRIDHVDGLYAPREYLQRLQWSYLAHLVLREIERYAAPEEGEAVEPPPSPVVVLRKVCKQLGLPAPSDAELPALFGPNVAPDPAPPETAEVEPDVATEATAAAHAPLFVVVEKILGPDEPLPERWPVAGTTGYDFANHLNGLFVVPGGYSALEKFFVRFTDDERNFADIVIDCKRLILRFAMASELQMLAHHLNRISEQHRTTRDFTLNSLRYALREVLMTFPVYRIYPGPDGVSERDQRFVTRAVAMARRRNRTMDPTTFDFIRDVLLLRHPPHLNDQQRRAREHFARRFQQVTSPIMAKGVEDTAFYVYFPLLSANEVGGHPAAAALSTDVFHQHNLRRRARTPHGLLATSTHDTKRSEDLRAHLNVLTEIAPQWRRKVNRWTRKTKAWRSEVDGQTAPSRHDEYLFYQTLVGMWPNEPLDAAARATLLERLQAYMEKATHEAKQRTSWINPNTEYDQAVRKFVEGCLTPDRRNRFLPEVEEFRRSIAGAGYYNAMSQVVLKLMSPGVPDVYQGQELWDFSLVDPDNRRPVDFARRAELLAALSRDWNEHPESRTTLAAQLAATPSDDRLKLLLTWRLLHLRNTQRGLFERGEYLPLLVTGSAAEHVTAFAWYEPAASDDGPSLAAVVVPRWWLKLAARGNLDDVTRIPSAADAVWQDTIVELPTSATTAFRNVLTDETHMFETHQVRLAQLLNRFPLAVLIETPRAER